MLVLKRFFKIFGQKTSSSLRQDDYFDDKIITGNPTTFKNSKDYLDAYQFINYVGQATDIICSDIAALDWQIVDDKGNEIEDSNIRLALEKPHPLLSWREFVKMAMLHLLLDGNCFILPNQKNMLAMVSGQFSDLQILIPSLVDIYTSQGTIRSQDYSNVDEIRSFEVRDSHVFKSVPPELMIHGKEMGPYNMIRGMGVVQRNATNLDADRITTLFNKQFIDNGVKADYQLVQKSDRKIGDTEWENMKKRMREKYEGYKNWFKIVFPPENSELKKINLSYDDVKYIEQKKMTRQDVFEVFFNIPPIRSGLLEGAKYDSAPEQKRTYYETTIPGYYTEMQDILTVIVKRINPKAIFRFINRAVSDPEMQANIAGGAYDKGSINGNEYRKRIGYPEDEKNDHLNTFYTTLNKIPADQAGMFPEEKEKSAGIKAPRASARAMLVHRIAKRTKAGLMPIVEKSVRKYYEGLERRALAGLEKNSEAINKKAANIDDVFNFTEEMKLAKNEANSFFTKIVVSAIKDHSNTFGLDTDFSFQNARIKLVVDRLNTQYADKTLNSRKKELSAILRKSLDAGQTSSEIKGNLQQYFKSLNDPKTGWKADRIARSEVSGAYDQASAISYREMGVREVQVVGCEDVHDGYDCDTDGSNGTYPIDRIDALVFHPNHTGSVVPVLPR
jgi:HK97 family phage portal protein